MRAQNEERLRILAEVQAGYLGIQEAMQLLQSLEASETAGRVSSQEATAPQRQLQFRRTQISTGQILLDLTIPISLLAASSRLGADLGLAESGLSHADLLKRIALAKEVPATLLEQNLEDQDLLLELNLI